jgi:drug/metabolite transporter (DMT)-like permease
MKFTLRSSPRSVTELQPSDNVLGAAGFVLGAIVVFSSQDTLSKILVVDYSPIEIAWFRYMINTLILIPFLLRSRGRMLVTRMPWQQTARAAAVLGSAVVFMAGLNELPIADATAINFVSPLVVTALSIPLLGEKVGLRRWIAVLVGFAGVLIIIRPGSGTFGWAALLPLFSATLWAIGLILTRRMSSTEPALTTLSYSTFLAAIALTLVLPFVWRTPDAGALILLLVIGVISVTAQYLMIVGYSRAAASVLAPLTYTQMIWSTTLGYLVFGAVPGLFTWIGGAVIVASGLYVLHRQRVRSRERVESV